MERRRNETMELRSKCRPSFSSILISAFANVSLNDSPQTLGPGRNCGRATRKGFPSGKFKGLGCSSEVSVPEVIRGSADWPTKRLKKKKQRSLLLKKGKRGAMPGQTTAVILDKNSGHVVSPDIWCSPGIGFSADDASVDCVISRRSAAGRGRIMYEKGNFSEHQHQHPCLGEGAAVPMEPCLSFGRRTSLLGVIEERQNRRVRHRMGDGLAEMMLLQSGLLLGGRTTLQDDRHRDLRLDIDNMSYEELLELGDRIGNVSTGLREEEIRSCLQKTRFSAPSGWPFQSPETEIQIKCSICQEEYEGGDQMGKLECGHGYHMGCIRLWLLRKNLCPVCKTLVPTF